jgi:hypothetical protein
MNNKIPSQRTNTLNLCSNCLFLSTWLSVVSTGAWVMSNFWSIEDDIRATDWENVFEGHKIHWTWVRLNWEKIEIFLNNKLEDSSHE